MPNPSGRSGRTGPYGLSPLRARVTPLILALGLALGMAAPASHAAPAETIQLNFVNAEIQSVIKTVGEHTGKNFILDPRVTGNVTIVSPSPVPRADLYPIFLSVLRSNGFAAVEQNGFVRIVPETDAKIAGSPTGREALAAKGDRIVTYVFQLQNESAVQLVTTLRPLVSPNNFIAAYPGNNAIVITDYAENVRRIQRIIQSVDQPSGGETQLFKLKYAQANDVVSLLARVVPELAPNPATPGALPRANVAVDTRTNSLIVRSDGGSILQRIRKLVADLDQPTNAVTTQVVYLKNADAIKVAETLRALLAANQSAAPSSTPAAAGSGTGAPAAGGATASSPAATPSLIQAFKETNSLVIAAPEPTFRNLKEVIDKLDARRAQVYIEALVAEVSGSVASELGIQWQGLSGLGNDGTRLIGGTNFNTSASGPTGASQGNIITAASQGVAGLGNLGPGLNLGVINGTIRVPGTNGTVELLNLGLLVKALETDGKANILSVPSTMTLDNEEASITVGQNIPVATGSYTVQSGGVQSPFQTIERKDIGLKLKVRPTIAEGGTVKLIISQEVSSLAGTATASREPILNKRSIDSTVLVEDGAVVVLGGLMQDDASGGVDKVPFLGDLPLIGNAFKYQNRKSIKTNLMVFIRPKVLRDGAATTTFSSERYDFIRNQQGATVATESPVLNVPGGPQLPAK
jgi:general secretion pathway protein D